MLDERDEVRKLSRPATEHEVAEAGRRLVDLLKMYDELEADKKEAVEGYNKRLKASDSEIWSLRQTIERGEVEEEVDCRAVFDFGRNSVTIVRKDDGLVVEERAMTAVERQERESPDLPTLESTPGTDGKSMAAGETEEEDGDAQEV